MRIDLADGKYTYVFDESTGRQETLRYGEPWRSLIGDKFVYCLAAELNEIVAKLDQLTTDASNLCQVMRGTQAETDFALPMFLLEETVSSIEGRTEYTPKSLKPHRWQKEIIAWACGETIQYRIVPKRYGWDAEEPTPSEWVDQTNPQWYTSENAEYRIKPK